MNGLGGAMLALIGGVLYLALSFVMGMEIGSLFIALVILSFVAFAAIAALSTVLPNNRFWLYPLMFSLPTLLVGLGALTSGSPLSFAVIGLATFLVGLAAAFLARKRQRNRSSHSNPSFNPDAAQ
jgi:hypothetical protein